MFDLRYHVASLAAVFLALIIGMLVGAGIWPLIAIGSAGILAITVAILASPSLQSGLQMLVRSLADALGL